MTLVTDKDLIVFLVSKGYKIKIIKRDKDRNRCLVYFDKTKELDTAILDFANKTETININEYQAAERRVKTLLCMQKNNK